MRIGAHESVAGGLHKAFEAADEDRAEAIQIFTKNANTWREPDLKPEVIEAFRARAAMDAEHRPTLSHNSYLINLASGDDINHQRSMAAMLAEVRRCVTLGVDYVVFHPGSCGAMTKGEPEASFAARQDAGLTQIAKSLSILHEKLGDVPTRILIENAAGSGGCLGCSLPQIATILERTEIGRERLGVCFDTQHAFASGYDLRTQEGYDACWAEFDKSIGLERLKAFHLNDSKKPLGSRVDRHDNIGDGLLGTETFRRFVNDRRFKDIPAVLETPFRDEVRPYRDEIALLRGLATSPSH